MILYTQERISGDTGRSAQHRHHQQQLLTDNDVLMEAGCGECKEMAAATTEIVKRPATTPHV